MHSGLPEAMTDFSWLNAVTIMAAFDSLADSMVDQFILALKNRLDMSPTQLGMQFIPGKNLLAAKVWIQLNEEADSSSKRSRLRLLEILLHLCKKWNSAFVGAASQELRGKVSALFSSFVTIAVTGCAKSDLMGFKKGPCLCTSRWSKPLLLP